MMDPILEQALRDIANIRQEIERLKTIREPFFSMRMDPNTRSFIIDQNNYDISDYNLIIVLTSAPRNLTGIQGGILNRYLAILHFGSTLTLSYESAQSTAANRIRGTVAGTVLTDGGLATLVYQSTVVGNRWRVISPY